MSQAPSETQPAWPEYGPAMMPPEAESQRFDILGMLLRRKWLIVFGMLVGGGLGYLFYQQQTPVYESQARVLITPKSQTSGINSATADPLAEYRKTRAHHEVMMSSVFLGELFQDQVVDLSLILESLYVEPSPENDNLYTLSFRSKEASSCADTLEQVMVGYKTYLDQKYASESSKVLQLLQQTDKSLRDEFDVKQAEIDAFIKDNLDDLALSNGSELVNLAQQHMQDVDGQRRELRRQMTDLANQLEMLEELIEQNRKPEAVRAIVDAQTNRYLLTGRDNETREVTLADRRVTLQMLLQKFGEDHPQVKLLRSEISVLEESVLSDPLGEISPERPDEFLNYHLNKIKREILVDEVKLSNLDKDFEKNKADAQRLNAAHLKLSGLLDEKQQIQDLRRSLNSQIKDADLSQDSNGFMYETLDNASLAIVVWPAPLKIFAVAIFLGGLLGVGLAYLVDLADKTFRAPDEISQALHLPIIGHVPYIPGGKVEKDPSLTQMHETLFVCHKPKSRLTEAVRGVRTSLFFSNRDKSHQVIQVTSPSPSDGKSTMAANLAISIAQSGKRVLLVDADLRRPRQHKLIGEDSDIGFASVLSGEVAPEEAVLETQITGLSFLPCGDRPSNPAELLTSPCLQDFIETVREQYDYVIIDSPPLLAVTDPSVIAPRVDGVILAFRIRKNIRVKADRAREILSAVGANIVGVVVNGIGGGHSYGDYKYSKYSKAYGANYYGKYGGYGNGPYGYGYNYGYGYDYSDAGKYYEEEGTERRKTAKARSAPPA